MNRLQQNILYTLIILTICLVFLNYPKLECSSHGIYLPQTKYINHDIHINDVQFYLNKNISLLKTSPIGLINIEHAYKIKNNMNLICKKNIQKAIELAAENGANKVIGYCVINNDNIKPDSLKTINLYAYAYYE